MERIIFLAYEFFTCFLPFIIVFFILKNIHKKSGTIFCKKACIMLFVFFVYTVLVFHVTGAGTLYNALLYGVGASKNQINILPFSRNIDKVSYFLNLIMLIPFGFLVPQIFRDKNGMFTVFFSGFLFSFLIEISQLLNNRRTDVDDLILNTLGAVIGYLVFKIFSKFFKTLSEDEKMPKIDLFIYIFSMFAGRFLLFNEMGFAKMIYGF